MQQTNMSGGGDGDGDGDGDGGRKKDIHVVMLPWLAFGHLIPFLDLSIALANSGIHVSYISTPRNILRLPKIPTHLSPLIRLISLPLPILHSNPLPDHAEATVDIPPQRMGCLKMACDLLRGPIADFIEHNLPHWIVVDFFQHWAIDIAREFNIPIIYFNITSASTAAFFTPPPQSTPPTPRDLTLPPPWFHFPSQVAYTAHEVDAIQNAISGLDATGISTAERLSKVHEGSRAIVVRSSMEFEGDYFKIYMKNMNGKPVFPLGFLTQKKVDDHDKNSRRSSSREWEGIFDWLDKQPPKTVVFVGFGSECKLTKDENFEIAHGVELSGVPFLWALRKPEWVSDEDEVLPPGFRTQVAGTGKGAVQFGWAPQREILGHPAVGGSLFHSGWTSIVETIVHGHVLVLLPMVLAQPLDARLMVEKGLGVEVRRDGVDGRFSRKGIAEAVQRVMVGSEGDEMKKRAEEAGETMFGNQQLNQDYINKLVNYLDDQC